MPFYQKVKEQLGRVFVAFFGRKRFNSFIVGIFGRLFWTPAAVVVLAENDEGEVLALDYKGSLRLPGGQVNYGEDPEDAARRELREETGLEVEVEELVDAISGSRVQATMIAFRGSIKGGNISSSWEGDPLFLEKEGIENMNWDEDFLPLVEKYLS